MDVGGGGGHGKPQKHPLGSMWTSRTLMTEEHSPFFCMTLAHERHHSTWHSLGLFRPKHIGGIIVRIDTAVVKRSDSVATGSRWTERKEVEVETHPLTH